MDTCCKNKITRLFKRLFRRRCIKSTDEALNVVSSFSNAKILYKKLCRLSHPDRFLDPQLKIEAQNLFQEVQEYKYNYAELKRLEADINNLHNNNI